MKYSLLEHGDFLEQHYWNLFIKDQFPSYEKFWEKFVVPLTKRPNDIHFRSNSDLKKINKSNIDIDIAQLNYSVFRNLIRSFEILKKLEKPDLKNTQEQIDLIKEGLCMLVAAQDNAFELLEKLLNPNNYEPFSEKHGKTARKNWIINHNLSDLEKIRNYRNVIIHHWFPSSIVEDTRRLCLPKIGKESKYLDWRLITEPSETIEEYKKDFISSFNIFEYAWNKTIEYLENNWKVL